MLGLEPRQPVLLASAFLAASCLKGDRVNGAAQLWCPTVPLMFLLLQVQVHLFRLKVGVVRDCFSLCNCSCPGVDGGGTSSTAVTHKHRLACVIVGSRAHIHTAGTYSSMKTHCFLPFFLPSFPLSSLLPFPLCTHCFSFLLFLLPSLPFFLQT